MPLDIRTQKSFFDRQAVLAWMGEQTMRFLSRLGARIRLTAMHSIRKRNRVSRPLVETPTSQTGLLRENIFYGLDPVAGAVVVGPVKLNIVYFDRSGAPLHGAVPEVLEHGGQIGIVEVWNGWKWVRQDLRYRGKVATVAALRGGESKNAFVMGLPRRRRTVTIAARPFMLPAMQRETAPHKLDELWAKSAPRRSGAAVA